MCTFYLSISFCWKEFFSKYKRLEYFRTASYAPVQGYCGTFALVNETSSCIENSKGKWLSLIAKGNHNGAIKVLICTQQMRQL